MKNFALGLLVGAVSLTVLFAEPVGRLIWASCLLLEKKDNQITLLERQLAIHHAMEQDPEFKNQFDKAVEELSDES